MPNFDQLPAASALTGTETLAVNQAGATKKVTAQDIADLGSSTGGVTEAGVRATPLTGINLTPPTTEPTPPLTATNTILQWFSFLWSWVQWLFMLLGWMPKVYNVVRFGAKGDGVTDDTAAIQAATNACFAAGGGTVWFPMPSGFWKVAGPLLTNLSAFQGSNPNCQIYIPISESGDEMISIEYKGEGFLQWASEVIVSAQQSERNTKINKIKSTIIGTGSRPCVFGSPWIATQYGEFNYTYVAFERLMIEVRTKDDDGDEIPSTMLGINGDHLVALTGYEMGVQSESIPANLLTPSGTYGIIMPRINNKAVVALRRCKVEGFEIGVQHNEHFVGEDLIVNGCVWGIELTAGNHPWYHSNVKLEGNRFNFRVNGNTVGTIGLLGTEHLPAGEFYSWEKDFDYNTGLSDITVVKCAAIKASIGYAREFSADFDINLKVLSGSGQNVFYDVPDSSIYKFYDSFNRPANNTSVGKMIAPNTATYNPFSGDWGIDSMGRLKCSSEGSTGSVVAQRLLVDCGESDYYRSVDVILNTRAGAGIIYRAVDGNNLWYLEVDGSNMNLYKMVSGSFGSPVASHSDAIGNIGNNTVSVNVDGDVHTIYKNGTQVISITDSTYSSATQIGYAVVSGTNFGGGVRFDNERGLDAIAPAGAVIFDKRWDSLTGWTASSDGGATIEIANIAGEDQLRMIKGGAFNNISRSFAFTPGDQLQYEVTDLVYGSGANIRLTLSNGSPIFNLDLPGGNPSGIIDTTGFPPNTTMFYLDNTSGTATMYAIKFTNLSI